MTSACIRTGRRLRSFAGAALVALLTLAARPASVEAQWQTVLTLTGWPLNVTTTSANDFEAGFVLLGSTTIAVDLTSALFGFFATRSTTVQVQCVAACPRSGSLALTGLQWRRDDQATWTTLTTAYVDIEERTATFNGANDPWSRTLLWRYVLSWTANPPAPASQFRVRFRLVVAAP